jgi:HSP20 family protein
LSLLKEINMTLVRRMPDQRSMQPRNTNIFERMLRDWPVPIDGALAEAIPALDVRETDDAYEITVDAPGVNPDELEVLVEGRTVTVRGRFEDTQERQEGRYLLRERRQGEFMRAVALPGMVELNQVTSRFENGQLTITLPKASESRPRRVEVSNGSNGKRPQSGGSSSSGAQGSSSQGASAQGASAQGTSAGRSTSAGDSSKSSEGDRSTGKGSDSGKS